MKLLRDKARQLNSKNVSRKDGDVEFMGDRGWNMVTGQRGDAPQTFRQLVSDGYRKNPVVSSCIRIIASALTDAQLVAQEKRAGEWVTVDDDHPAQQVVEFPNDRDTKIELLERGIHHFLLGGNVFWEMGRDGLGAPKQLFPIRPDRVVSAIVDDRDVPLVFRVLHDDGQEELIRAMNMVHITDVDPWKDIFGLPRLLSAALEIRTDNEASDYVSEVLTNHGQPGMIVGIDKRADPEMTRRMEEMWDEEYGPGRGRGKTAFVGGATQFHQIGFDLRELEFPDLRIITRESICAVMGVDPLMVAIGSAARGGTMSGNEHIEARKKLWVQTVIPIARRWEAGFNSFLAPEFGTDIRYKFDTSSVKALQPDRDKMMERAATMAEAGVYTAPEIREETGHDAEPQEDHVVSDMRTVYVPFPGRDVAVQSPQDDGDGDDDDGDTVDGQGF